MSDPLANPEVEKLCIKAISEGASAETVANLAITAMMSGAAEALERVKEKMNATKS